MITLKIYSWLSFTFLFFIIFVMRVACVSCHCLDRERHHLLQLKASLKFNYGPQYSDEKLLPWNNQSLDCCLWSGVGCSEDGKVVSLDLSRKGIIGVNDLSSLFSLVYLKSLNLAFNDFNSAFPTKFDGLINLNYLNLSYSGFSGQIPISISSLVNLKTLEISTDYGYQSSSIKLENPNLDTFIRNLSNLQELILDGVNILAKDDNWGRAISSSLPNLQVLSLSGCGLKGTVDFSLPKLRHLSEIRLSYNDLNGVFPKEVFHLQTVWAIDLRMNTKLRGSFPEISKNNSLKELKLSNTNFSGELPSAIFENLKSLSRMDISDCRFSGAIPKSLSNLTKLTHIDLSHNMFVGSIPSFTLLSDLTYLDLSENHFLIGSIHSTHWEGLTKLKNLHLSTNSLSGRIPMSVFRAPSLSLNENRFSDISNEHLNMSSSSSQLTYIDLSSNIINGPLPDLDMKNLRFLGLSSNNFSGPLPNSLFKCEHLSTLKLSYNSFSGIFDLRMMINQNQFLNWIDLSHSGLLVLDNGVDVSSSLPYISYVGLASCRLRTFPGIFRNLSYLLELDLSQNKISGEIPNWIWEVASHSLNLSHNFLEGIERPVLTVPSIVILDLHSNQLQGELPFFPRDAQYLDYSMNNFSSNIPSLIPSSDLYFLSLSNNHLNGSIPESICNCSSIQVLNLFNNSLSGPVPQCISTLNESLVVLNLGMNNLNGIISDALLQPGCQLKTLDLNGNCLSGKVPESLLNCKGLQVLNLGNNQINDTFPCWLKDVSNLSVLVLTSNKLHGELGCPETNGSWPMLQIVDLSSNSFSGKFLVDSFSSMKSSMVVNELKSISNGIDYGRYYQDTVTLNLKGAEVKLDKILTIFTSIDLSNNNFEGALPRELGNLRALYCLNLSQNNFTGQIPPSLGSLKQLESLDLSRNKLSGSIPHQLADLTFLAVLNLSFNQLEGRIPKGGQFDNLCEDSFLANKGLVGPQVKRKCNDDYGETVASQEIPLHNNNIRPKKSEVRWELIGAEVGFNVGLGIVIGSLVLWKRWREWYFDRAERVLLEIIYHQNRSRPNQLKRSYASWSQGMMLLPFCIVFANTMLLHFCNS